VLIGISLRKVMFEGHFITYGLVKRFRVNEKVLKELRVAIKLIYVQKELRSLHKRGFQ